MCKLRIGPYAMHFTGYQPEATGTKEFCEDIPVVGHTIVAFDAIDPPLRTVPLEVRVIRDTGDEHDLEAITVLHLQPKVYPSGSVTFEHDFTEPGKFVGLVMTSDDKGQYVSRFPFSVARGWTRLQPYLIWRPRDPGRSRLLLVLGDLLPTDIDSAAKGSMISHAAASGSSVRAGFGCPCFGLAAVALACASSSSSSDSAAGMDIAQFDYARADTHPACGTSNRTSACRRDARCAEKRRSLRRE